MMKWFGAAFVFENQAEAEEFEKKLSRILDNYITANGGHNCKASDHKCNIVTRVSNEDDEFACVIECGCKSKKRQRDIMELLLRAIDESE